MYTKFFKDRKNKIYCLPNSIRKEIQKDLSDETNLYSVFIDDFNSIQSFFNDEFNDKFTLISNEKIESLLTSYMKIKFKIDKENDKYINVYINQSFINGTSNDILNKIENIMSLSENKKQIDLQAREYAKNLKQWIQEDFVFTLGNNCVLPKFKGIPKNINLNNCMEEDLNKIKSVHMDSFEFFLYNAILLGKEIERNKIIEEESYDEN